MAYPESTNSASERLEQLLKYLEHTPENLHLLQDAIATAMEVRDLDNAKMLVAQGLNHHPDSAEINAHAGLLHLQCNEMEKAQACLLKAIGSGLKEASVMYNLAYSQYQLRNFDGALKTIAEIGDTDSLHKEITLLSARCKHNTDKLQSGIDELQAYLASHGNDQDAEGLLALMLCDNEQMQQAMHYANKSMSYGSPNFDGLMARAGAEAISRDYDNAYADFSKASAINPRSGRALSGLGQIDFYNFRFDEALEQLQNAVKYMPDHIGTWHLLGWTWLMKENFQQALEAFEKAYELDRTFGETHGGLAAVYALTDESAKADKHMKLAKKLAPDSFSYVYAEMVMLNKAGRPQEAQTLFDRVKGNHYEALGATPGALIESRLKELSKKPQQS